MIYTNDYESPLGNILLAGDEQGLTGLWFTEGGRYIGVGLKAVGGAVGHNSICIIVPCHRVVGANGNLTGYGGGILRKKALLELEGNDMSQFTIPTRGTAL